MQQETLVMANGREWAVACDVQRRFMRYSVPGISGLDYSAKCRQLHQLGGDCYDFLPLAGERLAVAVGDASGKGLAAALMISNVQSSLRTAAVLSGNSGAAVLETVNRQVFASSLDDRYATLFYAVFEEDTRTLRYVNAGHNPPVVLRPDGSIHWLEAGGAPVGMFQEWLYEEGSVQLYPGDVVLAYTDGVTEAVNSRGEEWGVEGLLRAARASRLRSAGGIVTEDIVAKDIVDDIFASLDEFTRGRQTDDATVLVMRVR
jgi:sigma-B regulation protein RsbU (phosphoserine phosphatase)